MHLKHMRAIKNRDLFEKITLKNCSPAIAPAWPCYRPADPHGGGECGKCMEQFSADPHGKDCSYNPVAFPPSMEVRCGKCEKGKQRFSAMELCLLRTSYVHNSALLRNV
jgi:hypothetical protein